jgi:hypothetical protein
MGLVRKAKQVLVRTPLHRPLLEVQSAWQTARVKRTPIRDVRTAYCISPHKTGTTFIAHMFDQAVSAHEPLHHPTLKHIQDPDFLRRRKAYLDLRVEASGFFAYVAKDFGELFPEDNMVFMIRDPSEWIGSHLNYAPVVARRVNYIFGRNFFWRRITPYDANDFYDLTDQQQHDYVTAMLHFWLKVYGEARDLPNGHIIRLNEADDNIELLEHLFAQKAVNLKTGFRRVNEEKKPFSAWDYVNKEDFADAIAEFGY